MLKKQFRFPLGYANQRPKASTWTVTGSGAVVICKGDQKQGMAKITGITTGKIVDYGVKDTMNMGACMAPAAASVVAAHFKDFGTDPSEYDQIITGDLGMVGKDILIRHFCRSERGMIIAVSLVLIVVLRYMAGMHKHRQAAAAVDAVRSCLPGMC